ncbi:MAG: FkbM family methyltransferase [Bacteroidetes bacterium]|nr:MAG: FkbM family methyltransferase [Bacteroidota bacterium]
MTTSPPTDDALRQQLLARLDGVARLARGSRLQRLWAAPARYLSGMWWRYVGFRWTGYGRVVSARTFFDASMQVVLPAGMDLYLLGAKTHDSELRLARFLVRHLPQGATVVDVGAHFGYFTLLAARLVGPGGRVHAFEASPATFEVLRANVQDWHRVHAEHMACSDAAGKVAFYEFPAAWSEYNTLRPEQYARANWRGKVQARRVEVPAMPLDAVVDDRPVALVKIDVEGAEPQVVAGMQRILARHQPVVVMEFQADEAVNAPHRQAADRLGAVGYRPFLIDPSGALVPAPQPLHEAVARTGLESDNVVWVMGGGFEG